MMPSLQPGNCVSPQQLRDAVREEVKLGGGRGKHRDGNIPFLKRGVPNVVTRWFGSGSGRVGLCSRMQDGWSRRRVCTGGLG